MKKGTLVIFDYSGTLSLEATAYGSEDNILRQLEKTGLKDLGIDTPKIFWDNIVNPTWQTGSTTPVGYKQVMQARIKELTTNRSVPIDETLISGAVGRFVDDYFKHSLIDFRWQQILNQLACAPAVRTVIATDHYAEATRTIVSALSRWDIKTISVKQSETIAASENPFVVANSSDIGAHKSERQYWITVKAALQPAQFHHILLIDDFGLNEQAEDLYGTRQAANERKKAIILLLQDIFSVDIVAIPFGLDEPPQNSRMLSAEDIDKRYSLMIERTSSIIEGYLCACGCDDL